MALRAYVNNEEVVSSLLEEKVWQEIRSRYKKKEIVIKIPATGGLAHPRVSKNGLRYFAHNPGEAPLNWQPESMEHQLLKHYVVIGCKNAGWQARTEVEGEGWIADVLAVKGQAQIGIEVQWSPQTLEKTKERQLRYQSSNVRACWLFRLPPVQIKEEDTGELVADKDLPLFQLVFEDSKFYVLLQERQIEVSYFIENLLKGKYKYSDTVNHTGKVNANITIVDVKCSHCQTFQHEVVADLFWHDQNENSCKLLHLYRPTLDYSIRYHPKILDKVQELQNSLKGTWMQLVEIKRAEDWVNTISSCRHCKRAFQFEHLIKKEEGFNIGIIEINLPKTELAVEPHWCSRDFKYNCI